VREAVKLEEQSAQSEVIDVPRGQDTYRIGVIDIPTFYIDFKALQQGDPEYKSTTRDVQRLIEEPALRGPRRHRTLTTPPPASRWTASWSTFATTAAAPFRKPTPSRDLFIEAGPTVQIRSASGRVDLLTTKMARWPGKAPSPCW
jgi:carboxyl-terminal processing protease